jgi:hypothetical protein
MPRLLDHLTDLFKKTATIDHALRYNAVFYSPVRKMLRELDSMDRGARLTLSDYLTQRTLDWAARLPDGVPAGVSLQERPLLEKSDLRFTLLRQNAPLGRAGMPGLPSRSSCFGEVGNGEESPPTRRPEPMGGVPKL